MRGLLFWGYRDRVFLFMAVDETSCFVVLDQCKKKQQTQLGTNIILHSSFSEAIKEHKS
jgi:hypothetical protein